MKLLKQLFAKRATSPKENKRRILRSAIESLESRRLFSSIIYSVNDAINHTITVDQTPLPVSSVTFTDNGVQHTYNGSFSEITVDCSASSGNETITVNSGVWGLCTLNGGSGNDTIHGGAGDDSISGGSGNDYLAGGTGNDMVNGGSGNDSLYGDDGNDTLIGDIGSDDINGGNGEDSVDYRYETSGINVTVGSGINDGAAGENDNVHSDCEIFYAPNSNSSIDASLMVNSVTVFGGTGNDTIYGGSANDSLSGGSGNDYLAAGAGNDMLNGGAGNDSLYGQDGNDTLIGDIGSDDINGGNGADSVDYRYETAGITVTVGSGIDDGATGENDNVHNDCEIFYAPDFSSSIDASLVTSSVTLFGGSGNDTLTGGAGGNDSIVGFGGNDELHVGSGGGDTLDGGDGDDSFYSMQSKVDTVIGGAGTDVAVQKDAGDHVTL